MIVLDLAMAATRDLETLERIRQRLPSLPVVVVFGNDDQRIVQKSNQLSELGISRFFLSPSYKYEIITICRY